MRKSLLKTEICVAAVVAAFSILPTTAPAAKVVPPGNSAATQYTETLPTSGGNAEVGGGNESKHQSPAKTLGSKTAKQLEERGPEGEAVADFAAETTPSSQSSASRSEAGSGGGKGSSGAGSQGGTESAGGVSAGGAKKAASAGGAAVSVPSGSSGFGEAVSYTTGSTSGEMGLFLPLILIGALIWASSHAWRSRSPGREIP